MKQIWPQIMSYLTVDINADRVVPPTGFTARLTVFASAAMTFLAVFALTMSLAAGRLADRWESELAQSSTIRISAPAGQVETQIKAVERVLETTPGVVSFRILDEAEQRALLAPWFGPDLPLDTLPIPRLVEVIEDDEGFSGEGLRLRLAGEAPGAVLDDHTRWRAPLVDAAKRLRLLGYVSILLIACTTAATIVLAANAALSANLPVIRVLRLIGATDTYIARAFVRRFTLRSLLGAAIGAVLATIAVLLLPASGNADAGGVLSGLGLRGAQWLLPFAIPLLAGIVSFMATRFAAQRILRGLR